MIHTNLGMYTESIVDRTIEYYNIHENQIFIEKRNVPIKIIKKIDNSTVIGKLIQKSYIDYFGVINNKYFEYIS